MESIIPPADRSTRSFAWSSRSGHFPTVNRPRPKWWNWVKWEALLLTCIVAAIFLIRLADMSIRGEESRWATVAMEMIRTGDWVVPRQQGEPFLSRPPLGSWLIAVCSLLRGECDVWTIRLPTIIAILLTSVLIYGYSRVFLSEFGAFTAGIAYATMGQVLQLGRVGETEAVFTFFVSGSLLVWHLGYVKKWPPVWTWVAGYAFAALGALTKGPQAPIYFVAATGIFLLLNRDWRRLVSLSHLAGLGVFVGIIACWQIPFFLKLGWPGTHAIWASDTAMRIWEINLLAVTKHLIAYPFELLACTLPWSLFLGVFLIPAFRHEMGLNQASGVSHDPGARRMANFLMVCLAVTFPSCWLIPGAHGRYFMPLFPCVAPLVGLVVERCGMADTGSYLHRIWRISLVGMSLVIGGFGLVIFSASWLGFPDVSMFIQEKTFGLVFGVCAVALATILWCQQRWVPKTPPTLHRAWWSRHQGWVGICALAGFMAVTYDTVVLNFHVRKNGVTAEQVAMLKDQLPPGVSLVSFGPIHHLFAYHFQEAISLRTWPLNDDDPIEQPEYFCFDRNKKQAIPFAWDEVASISCDRDRTVNPEEVVIVGRRVDYP